MDKLKIISPLNLREEIKKSMFDQVVIERNMLLRENAKLWKLIRNNFNNTNYF